MQIVERGRNEERKMHAVFVLFCFIPPHFYLCCLTILSDYQLSFKNLTLYLGAFSNGLNLLKQTCQIKRIALTSVSTTDL